MTTKTEELIEEMNSYYRNRAPWHDQYLCYAADVKMEQLLRPIIEDVEPLIAGRNVLEIACGTGNWTQVLAARAKAVLATDVNVTMLEQARAKDRCSGTTRFVAADAYSLAGVGGRFEAAFAADWWSHIPRSRLLGFLQVLHRRLESGAVVLFLEMERRGGEADIAYRYFVEGNEVGVRVLPNGKTYRVVKNYYNEAELKGLLGGLAHNFKFYRYDSLKRWMLSYTVL